MSSVVKLRSVVSVKKSKMSQTITGRGSHLGIQIGLKNLDLVEGIEFLQPFSFTVFYLMNSSRHVVGKNGLCNCFSLFRVEESDPEIMNIAEKGKILYADFDAP